MIPIEHPTCEELLALVNASGLCSPEEAAAFAEAWPKAFVSRGPRKGRLLTSCPAGTTPEAAIWQGLISNVNPFKMSIWRIMCFRDHARTCYSLAERITLRADMDSDRAALTAMGAW